MDKLERFKMRVLWGSVACLVLMNVVLYFKTYHSSATLQYPEPKITFATKNGADVVSYGAGAYDLLYITSAMDFMPKAVAESVKCVIVRWGPDDIAHFQDKARPDGRVVVGHCHDKSGFRGIICLYGPKYDAADVVHESAHAYDLVVDKGDEWRGIAGDVYGYERYEDEWDFPRDGLLTHYSSKNSQEDIAEWVAAVYDYRVKHYNSFRGVDKRDKRYVLKLEYLRKYGFVGQDDYDAIAPLLK